MALSIEQQYLVNLLRSMLSMRVTAASGSAFQLPSKLSDVELWEDVRLGLNMFNTTPPIITMYSSKDLYDASSIATASNGDPLSPETETLASIFNTSVMMCAMFFTGLRLQWFEAGKHFRYNDNGITLERVKQQDYQNIGTGILQYISTTLPAVRKTLGFKRIGIKGQWSGTISMPRSLTRGLRGTRLGNLS
ncbi:MAG: hypothetical protein WC979_07895 [Candidatus Pacearchaeota archaeon]|jgi:hypothetical protein